MQIKPVISEKSYSLANDSNKYTFLVPMSMPKIEIAKQIENEYKVKVVSVNTVKRPGKLSREWKYLTYNRASDSKKAIVQLKEGDSIKDFINI